MINVEENYLCKIGMLETIFLYTNKWPLTHLKIMLPINHFTYTHIYIYIYIWKRERERMCVYLYAGIGIKTQVPNQHIQINFAATCLATDYC